MKRVLRTIEMVTQIPAQKEEIFTTTDIMSLLNVLNEVTGYDIEVIPDTKGILSLKLDGNIYPVTSQGTRNKCSVTES